MWYEIMNFGLEREYSEILEIPNKPNSFSEIFLTNQALGMAREGSVSNPN